MKVMAKLKSCLVAATAFLLRVVQVRTAYSIIGSDSDTGQVGGAAASCIATDLFPVLYGSAPGKGVLHAQAFMEENEAPKGVGVALLKKNTPPDIIVRAMTNVYADPACCVLEVPHRYLRQYGVVDVKGRGAGYTGPRIKDIYTMIGYAGTDHRDVQGKAGNFTYSVQGNAVTRRVIQNAERAFSQSGCDLAARLMLALKAGAMNGEGDSRCTKRGIASSTSFIHVDNPDGTVFLHLKVVNSTEPHDSITMLQVLYDIWREKNPCPSVGSAQSTHSVAFQENGVSFALLLTVASTFWRVYR